MSAEELKNLGNEAFSKSKFEDAVDLYTQAIQLDPDNHLLYTNRSAALIGLKKFERAIDDADFAMSLSPTFTKAYYRKAAAQEGLGDFGGSFHTWTLAKQKCESSPLLQTQFLNTRKKWLDVMRSEPVHGSDDLLRRYALLTDSREKLSTIAHFWNASSPAERKAYFIRFLEIVGGAGGPAVDVSNINEADMITMPMQNYVDLPETRISSWMEFFNGIESNNKTNLLSDIWRYLSSQEQHAVILDLKTFLGRAV